MSNISDFLNNCNSEPGQIVESISNFDVEGYLPCDGSWHSKQDYPKLYEKLKSFNLFKTDEIPYFPNKGAAWGDYLLRGVDDGTHSRVLYPDFYIYENDPTEIFSYTDNTIERSALFAGPTGNVVYSRIYDSDTGIYHVYESTDYGNTFPTEINIPTGCIFKGYGNGNLICTITVSASFTSRIYWSNDNGATWHAVANTCEYIGGQEMYFMESNNHWYVFTEVNHSDKFRLHAFDTNFNVHFIKEYDKYVNATTNVIFVLIPRLCSGNTLITEHSNSGYTHTSNMITIDSTDPFAISTEKNCNLVWRGKPLGIHNGFFYYEYQCPWSTYGSTSPYTLHKVDITDSTDTVLENSVNTRCIRGSGYIFGSGNNIWFGYNWVGRYSTDNGVSTQHGGVNRTFPNFDDGICVFDNDKFAIMGITFRFLGDDINDSNLMSNLSFKTLSLPTFNLNYYTYVKFAHNPANGTIVFIDPDNLYVSTDYGENFTLKFSESFTLLKEDDHNGTNVFPRNSLIAFHGNKWAVVYEENKVLFSNDNGSTWNLKNLDFTASSVQSTQDGNWILMNNDKHVYFSEDDFNTTVDTTVIARSYEITQAKNNEFNYISGPTSDKMLRTNDGLNYQILNLELSYDLADKVIIDNQFMLTVDFKSKDYGISEIATSTVGKDSEYNFANKKAYKRGIYQSPSSPGYRNCIEVYDFIVDDDLFQTPTLNDDASEGILKFITAE